MNTTAARTDIHRPSAPEFDPEAYRLIDVYDMNDTPAPGRLGPADPERFARQVEALAAAGISRGFATGGCGHCGQTNLRYVALLVRDDVAEWIIAGQDCLSRRFQALTADQFRALQKRAAAARAEQKLLTGFRAACEQYPALAYATYVENIERGIEADLADLAGRKPFGRGTDQLGTTAEDHRLAVGTWGTATAWDIARKARQYGAVSVAQAALLDRIMGELEGKVADYRTKLDARDAEAAAAGPVPTGRVVLEGVIVGLREVEDNFSYNGGTIVKMTVKLDNGSRVYGTMPAALTADRNDRVRFTAAVEPSNDDASFGFFKRPTKAEVIA